VAPPKAVTDEGVAGQPVDPDFGESLKASYTLDEKIIK